MFESLKKYFAALKEDRLKAKYNNGFSIVISRYYSTGESLDDIEHYINIGSKVFNPSKIDGMYDALNVLQSSENTKKNYLDILNKMENTSESEIKSLSGLTNKLTN